MKLNKELEEVLDNIPQIADFTSGGEPIYSKKYVIHAMKEYATSKYVEKQKIEFAIEQLNIVRTYFDVGKLTEKEYSGHIRFTNTLLDKIKELQLKLSTL